MVGNGQPEVDIALQGTPHPFLTHLTGQGGEIDRIQLDRRDGFWIRAGEGEELRSQPGRPLDGAMQRAERLSFAQDIGGALGPLRV